MPKVELSPAAVVCDKVSHARTRAGIRPKLLDQMVDERAGGGLGRLSTCEQRMGFNFAKFPIRKQAHKRPAVEILAESRKARGLPVREWAMTALDKANRRWRLAFVGHSWAAVEAVVAQGPAVTVRSEHLPCEPAPTLERRRPAQAASADIRLHRAPGRSETGGLFATHIAAAIQ